MSCSNQLAKQRLIDPLHTRITNGRIPLSPVLHFLVSNSSEMLRQKMEHNIRNHNTTTTTSDSSGPDSSSSRRGRRLYRKERDTPCGGLQILLQELINYSRVNRSFIKTCTHHKHPRPTSLDVYPAVTLYLPTWRIPPPRYLQPKKMNVNPPPDSERLIVL